MLKKQRVFWVYGVKKLLLEKFVIGRMMGKGQWLWVNLPIPKKARNRHFGFSCMLAALRTSHIRIFKPATVLSVPALSFLKALPGRRLKKYNQTRPLFGIC